MAEKANRRNRRSIRLKGHDYSQPGGYFITICTWGRAPLFGEIVEGVMRLNDPGRIVEDTWRALPQHYANVELDAFVVMPNHIHGIIVLVAPPVGAGLKPAPTPGLPDAAAPSSPSFGNTVADSRDGTSHLVNTTISGGPTVGAGLKPAPTPPDARHGLPEIVRAFKTFSARKINATRGLTGVPVWQRSYFEHVVRDESALDRIRRYIEENPLRWDSDHENPAAIDRGTDAL